MQCSAKPVAVEDIAAWRDIFRREMNCQIVHDSLHRRQGWTEQYLLEVAGGPAGYGSVVVGGPWQGTRTIFEFFVAPPYRSRVFDLFDAFVGSSAARAMTVQTNDAVLNVLLHSRARDITSEKIVFADQLTTTLPAPEATLRRRDEPDSDWVVEIDGATAARGGILYHYNRPFGDIYMEVGETFRRRGLGSWLVQELKRICYEMGSLPCARCNTDNIASRKTLQKAGFVPCAHILNGAL